MSGIVTSTTTVLNESSIKTEYATKVRQVQKELDALIMADSNYFCPLKTGKLQQSAIINTRLGSGVIIWRTPYARRQYYEYSKPPYQPNPNACGRWFDAAKARWLDKWVRFTNERIKRK